MQWPHSTPDSYVIIAASWSCICGKCAISARCAGKVQMLAWLLVCCVIVIAACQRVWCQEFIMCCKLNPLESTLDQSHEGSGQWAWAYPGLRACGLMDCIHPLSLAVSCSCQPWSVKRCCWCHCYQRLECNVSVVRYLCVITLIWASIMEVAICNGWFVHHLAQAISESQVANWEIC